MPAGRGCSCVPCGPSEGHKGQLAAVPAGACPGQHAAKLALAGSFLTDSSRGWRLGTKVESALAAEAAAAGGSASDIEVSGVVGAAGGRGCSDGECVELLAVGTGPSAMRNSTEKEQALLAAGK